MQKRYENCKMNILMQVDVFILNVQNLNYLRDFFLCVLVIKAVVLEIRTGILYN